ncbi:hypothetical protein BBH88_02590 [Planococcus antarcticus DSM 14505]|uniref:Transposase n=1 Tax=Planococcus antarcticus DSM 14505 TaxID=1185653 RepID=A0ABM6D1J7_9BACL|nr:hypothetical protein BBH88_02590 [Planococcus antarcticus DSM 14505]
MQLTLAEKYEVINAVVRKFQLKNLVGTLCRTAQVSQSGYYAWLKKTEQHAIREEQDYLDYLLLIVGKSAIAPFIWYSWNCWKRR